MIFGGGWNESFVMPNFLRPSLTWPFILNSGRARDILTVNTRIVCINREYWHGGKIDLNPRTESQEIYHLISTSMLHLGRR